MISRGLRWCIPFLHEDRYSNSLEFFVHSHNTLSSFFFFSAFRTINLVSHLRAGLIRDAQCLLCAALPSVREADINI